jgi:hypothetical protein
MDIMKKQSFYIASVISLGLLLSHLSLVAQVPFVKSIDKNKARPQESIDIQGINFGTNAANIQVQFGNVFAVPQKITDQFIEVNLPYGATYENIHVVNTSTGLTGNSKDAFLLSFGGTNPLAISEFAGQLDFNSESNLYDMAMADFDGDGKLDIATANENSTNISVFLNTSSIGSISFSKTLLSPGVNTFHVAAGDLNGDGKPEIILSEFNGSRLFIYKNNSSVGNISFTSQILTIAGAKVSQVKVADIDLDGHRDLVITDQSMSRVFVAVNQSTIGAVAFPVIKSISFSGTTALDGLAVGDLDGDGFPEIAASEFQSPSGIIYILKNTSAPGTPSFNIPITVTATTAVSNLGIGDLDGDSKPDLSVSALLANSVLVYGNLSTSSSIQFALPKVISANARPWGIEFGDMDGDGKTDIAVSSIVSPAVTILNNTTSSAGNFTFQTLIIPATYINRFVKIGDLDNDGRPDLSFASVDDLNTNILSSKVSVFRNTHCVVPQINPVGPLVQCSSLTQRLTASSNPGSTYQWFKNGVSLAAPSTTSYLDVNASGSYTVQLVNGSCTNLSASVSVTVAAGSSSPVTPTPIPPVCVGGTLNLSVNNVGATDYVWTGPAFSTPAHGVSVSSLNFQANQAGEYTVSVLVGTCLTQQATIIVDVVDIPLVQVVYSGSEILCQGQTKIYSVYPSPTGYSFQWAEQTAGDISGQTNPYFSATTTGNYFIKLKSTLNASCAVIQTLPKKVRVAALPLVDFAMPSTACTYQLVSFTDQSTVDSDTVGLHVKYAWDFGDGATALLKNPTHTFTTVSALDNVTLSVSYINQSCLVSKIKGLPIQAAPVVSITNPSSIFSFCPSDSVLLEVVGAFDSYLWSNGESTSSIYAKQEGTYSVDVALGGCTITPQKIVTKYAVNVVASATPDKIKKGATSQLSVSGLNTFLWRPNKTGLSDSLISDPVATPLVSTLYTVTGTDANGCTGTTSVEVSIIEENSFLLSPDKMDGVNDSWQVVETGKQCGVTIYDERGFNVFEADPYLNDWKGVSSNGKSLPAGAYYFILKCSSVSGYTAGCINLIR